MIENLIDKYYIVYASILVVIWIILYSLKDKKDEESIDIVLNFFGGSIVMFMFGPILSLIGIALFIIIGIPVLLLDKFRGK